MLEIPPNRRNCVLRRATPTLHSSGATEEVGKSWGTLRTHAVFLQRYKSATPVSYDVTRRTCFQMRVEELVQLN
jgi:hypothetical protein